MTNKFKINLTVEVDTGKCDYAAESVGNPKQVTFKSSKVFTKSDLKDGMIVHYRNGINRLFFDNKLIRLNDSHNFMVMGEISLYKECLNYYSERISDLDIVKVTYMDNLVWSRD